MAYTQEVSSRRTILTEKSVLPLLYLGVGAD